MSSKRHYGKQVFSKLILRDSFLSQEAFEAEIKQQFFKVESSWWLYKNSNTGKGIVKIHRNRQGAKIVAYDYKKP